MASAEFDDFSEFIKKLEKLGIDVPKALEEAIPESLEPVRADMEKFMLTDRATNSTKKIKPKKVGHILTGDTLKSLSIRKVRKHKDGNIVVKVGFDVKKGGFPAIFLNVGTPYNDPTFFIQTAKERHIDEVRKILENKLEEAINKGIK